MKKVTYIVSLLMAVGLVLTAMALVPASAAQSPATEEEAAVPIDFTIDLEPGHREAYPEETIYTHVGVGKIEQVPAPKYPPGVKLSAYVPVNLRTSVVVIFEDNYIQPGHFTRMHVHAFEHAPHGNHVITVIGTAYCHVTGVTVTREVGFLLTIHHVVPPPPINWLLIGGIVAAIAAALLIFL